MRKLFKERKLFKGGNYMRKYGIRISYVDIFKRHVCNHTVAKNRALN